MLIIFFLTFTFLLSFTSYSSAQSNIVINEFESNPLEDDHQAGKEWVELYNPTTSSVDISNWKIMSVKNKTIVLPEGTIIRAYGYYIANYSGQWLEDDNELLILQDSSGNEIDRTPPKSDTENNDKSWSRYPNGVDTDTENDWKFQESTKESDNGGEETSPTPTPTTESTITPEATSSLPQTMITTETTTTSSDQQTVPVASVQQTTNYMPYITIPIATLAAVIVSSVYMFKIRTSKIQQKENQQMIHKYELESPKIPQNRKQKMIHEYELALEAINRKDIATARSHVIAARQLREKPVRVMEFSNLQNLIRDKFVYKNRQIDPRFMISLLVEEVGELSRAVRKGAGDEIGEGIANIIFSIISIANQFEIDIESILKKRSLRLEK